MAPLWAMASPTGRAVSTKSARGHAVGAISTQLSKPIDSISIRFTGGSPWSRLGLEGLLTYMALHRDRQRTPRLGHQRD